MKILGLALGQNQSAWESLDTATGEVTRGWVRMDDHALRKLLDHTRPEQRVIESGPRAARGHGVSGPTVATREGPGGSVRPSPGARPPGYGPAPLRGDPHQQRTYLLS